MTTPVTVAHRASDENHRSHRSGWLRAAVLGANDGLLSTAALLTGVAAGNASRSTIVLTGVAAMAAGAFSMAAGEYGSVSTQRDSELADIAKERRASMTTRRPSRPNWRRFTAAAVSPNCSPRRSPSTCTAAIRWRPIFATNSASTKMSWPARSRRPLPRQ